ncbi:aminotransferase class V-fold PLP-dependent enzyme [Paracidovorax cattleyae]|uniref:Isopenicillin-N epimerase n=1 Tax=Paracidovorax cattleyae TaxID=80868 RepID=A0A1H0MBY9_9BURK|nr:aminotransferase class V-fold PLP-dependent enzyme [Paracidovorax cattleyae]MBF9264877.1 aminotransferase class V-fold PLP-dependent enzyme [Paracidovorax cattleyae]SDO77887.1 isopenicillin-N epimerase [Paracidovorax cattleyae]
MVDSKPLPRKDLPVREDGHRERFLLDPDVVCLNHGMLGACPREVLERQSELRERMERLPSAFILREFQGLLDAARQALAQFVSADPADLVLLPNVTTALSAVLLSIPLAPGDEILTTDHAYLSCMNLLDFVARKTGARIVVASVEVPVSGPDAVVDAVVGRATPLTRLAVLDHVTSPTGIVFPIEALVERLAVRGIDTLVDGAHTPGMLPLDVQAIGAAYYAGNCHKWLCSPRGAGFLHVRRDRQADLHPPVISRGYGMADASRPRLHWEFDWLGTNDPTALLCIPDAIRFLDGLMRGGMPALMDRNRRLALKGASHLAMAGLPIKRLAPDAMLGSMVAYQLPDALEAAGSDAAASLQRQLCDLHGVDVAVTAWPADRGRVLRASAQIYNTTDDFNQLVAALRSTMASPSPIAEATGTANTGSKKP